MFVWDTLYNFCFLISLLSFTIFTQALDQSFILSRVSIASKIKISFIKFFSAENLQIEGLCNEFIVLIICKCKNSNIYDYTIKLTSKQ